MSRKISLGLLWLGFCIYALFLAPPKQPDTFELIENLVIGNWQGINPLVIALFNLMGVLPLIYQDKRASPPTKTLVYGWW